MTVSILNHTPLSVAVMAARTCWDSNNVCYSTPTDTLDPKDAELLHRLVTKYKHESIIEHCTVTFQVKGVSRGLLQQHARHRMQNLSVRSTRYTLYKQLKKRPLINEMDEVAEFCVLTGNPYVDARIGDSLRSLQVLIKERKIDNDKLKYALPEAFKTEFVTTMNIRALRHYFKLRMAKDAHNEIRNLATAMYNELPDEWKFLFSDVC